MSRADEALPQEIRNTGAFDLSVRLARCPADGRAVVAKAFADADAALPARIRQPRDSAAAAVDQLRQKRCLDLGSLLSADWAGDIERYLTYRPLRPVARAFRRRSYHTRGHSARPQFCLLPLSRPVGEPASAGAGDAGQAARPGARLSGMHAHPLLAQRLLVAARPAC